MTSRTIICGCFSVHTQPWYYCIPDLLCQCNPWYDTLLKNDPHGDAADEDSFSYGLNIGGGGDETSSIMSPRVTLLEVPVDFEAEYEFQRMYVTMLVESGRLEGNARTIASSDSIMSFDDSRIQEFLKEARDTLGLMSPSFKNTLVPSEILRGFKLYERAIRFCDQPEMKAKIITEYEERKSFHDEENEQDKGQSEFYIEAARNPAYGPIKRLDAFMHAIFYTNDANLRKTYRAEYYAYAEALTKMK